MRWLSGDDVRDFVFEFAHFLKAMRMGIFKVVVRIGEDSGDDLDVSFMGLRHHFGGGAIGNKHVAAKVSHKIDGLFAFGVGSKTIDGPDGFHREASFLGLGNGHHLVLSGNISQVYGRCLGFRAKIIE